MLHRHRVLGVDELLEQILLFLTSPRDLLHTALVCRSFVGVALHVLWRAHQFSLGPLLRCAPRPVRPRSFKGNLPTVAAPHSGREVAAWTPFRQYAHSMSVLSYSDKYDVHERFLHCTTVPNVLRAIQGALCSTPLFPLLRRLNVTITRPGGWLDDFLPHIPSFGLQYLWIEYHANHLFSDGILDILAHLSERTPSLCRLKLRLYGRYLAPNAPRIDLFFNPEKHSSLQVLFLDCAFLSPLSLSRMGRFPSLRHLTMCLQEATMPQLLSPDSLSFDHLVRLNLRVTQAKLAILFFQRIGRTIPEMTHISISIYNILPIDRDFGEISYQIRRLCLPTSFKTLEILFKEQALGNSPPPLVSENPGYGLHMFQPLLDFSLIVLNVSVQLPPFPPTQSYVAQMASAWINLISIRIDVGRLVPFDQHLAVSICDLIPFFQACKRLRRLYIPFQYLISYRLPSRGIHAYALLDLGLGYVNPSSRDALFLAQWLQIVAPGLPEITLADANGDTGVYRINDLAKIEETIADSN